MGTIRDEIAKNIAFYRKRKGMTQRELAGIVGVKHNSVSTWESGANAPDVELIFKLADLFQITVSDIYGQATPRAGSSPAAQRVARLYDLAIEDDRAVVEAALRKYDKTLPEKKKNTENT